ncbi:hypothetical protein PK12_003810 [Salmonella enterica subsp. enterica]|nr:hypothetical protein [Salmonella enterica subsp. enterica serovar Oranienburg]EDQ2493168.1 hypothetical protein [Salmonella enterica subsp. enterica serovar Bonariensis]
MKRQISLLTFLFACSLSPLLFAADDGNTPLTYNYIKPEPPVAASPVNLQGYCYRLDDPITLRFHLKLQPSKGTFQLFFTGNKSLSAFRGISPVEFLGGNTLIPPQRIDSTSRLSSNLPGEDYMGPAASDCPGCLMNTVNGGNNNYTITLSNRDLKYLRFRFFNPNAVNWKEAQDQGDKYASQRVLGLYWKRKQVHVDPNDPGSPLMSSNIMELSNVFRGVDVDSAIADAYFSPLKLPGKLSLVNLSLHSAPFNITGDALSPYYPSMTPDALDSNPMSIFRGTLSPWLKSSMRGKFYTDSVPLNSQDKQSLSDVISKPVGNGGDFSLVNTASMDIYITQRSNLTYDVAVYGQPVVFFPQNITDEKGITRHYKASELRNACY